MAYYDLISENDESTVCMCIISIAYNNRLAELGADFYGYIANFLNETGEWHLGKLLKRQLHEDGVVV